MASFGPLSQLLVKSTYINVLSALKCGCLRTEAIKPNYPKGIRFWSDPNRPSEEIITVAPLPRTPPTSQDNNYQSTQPKWQNESDEETVEDIQIPDTELERTQILTMNVRSCYSGRKRTEVTDGVQTINPDVAILTETWLQEGDREFNIVGYNPIMRCDRPPKNGKKLKPKERGGGVLILAKDYIKISGAVAHPLDNDIQVITFVLDKITIFAVYRAPGTNKAKHRLLTEFLEHQINKLGDRPFIITGDINLRDLAEVGFDPELTPVGAETDHGLQVKTHKHMWTMLLKKHNIDQHVEEPTCQTGGILDYVFAPDYLDIPKIRVDRHSFLPVFDHYAVVFEIDSFYQRTREEVFRRKETKHTWRKFHEIMPLQCDIVKNMPLLRDGLTSQELIDKMSNYIIDILKKAYEEATPLIKCKPPPRGGYLSKATLRQLAHTKRLWRTLTKSQEDESKPHIRAKMKILNRSNRWMIRNDREAWELRRLHLAENRQMNFYKFMNAITYKTKTLGPIMSTDGKLKTSDKEMSVSFNDFLCNLMTPSSAYDIDWDKNHEPKHVQLYLAAIPGSTTLKPLEDETVNGHIQNLHKVLINYGYVPAVGDIIDGYPLGTQPRGQKALPIVITYKDQKTMETVKAASIRAGFWDDRKHRNEPNCPKGFFTSAYSNLKDMLMTGDEIREAIVSSKRDSAAGPDGIKMAVFSEASNYVIAPLKIMFNTINDSGLIPKNFKTAKVIMLHKKNSKQEMSNYRPISMSNHISKIYERVFNERIMYHLKRHNRLSKQQHGFRPKMGCHTNLLESWEKGIDMADKHGPTKSF